MAPISENIKNLRESKKWSKRELADKMGFKTYTTISKWETGVNHPRIKDLQKLCDLFGVTSDCILGINIKEKKH